MNPVNESGIQPQGDRVLVRIEDLGMKKEHAIFVPDSVKDQHKEAQMAGLLTAVGDDAWSDYSKPFASIGQRIMFARHGGIKVTGKDGINYRIMNDVDITATLEEGVEFHDLAFPEKRTSLGAG
jgi:co-chaperonin GroES (HSP10)